MARAPPTVELARFGGLETGRYDNAYEEDSTFGRISFVDAQFASPLIHFYTVSANLVFEKATGTLVNVFSGFWSANEADMMSPELLRALCHAKCDAVEATPLS